MKPDRIDSEYNLDQKYQEPINGDQHLEINEITQDSHHLPDGGDCTEISAIILHWNKN